MPLQPSTQSGLCLADWPALAPPFGGMLGRLPNTNRAIKRGGPTTTAIGLRGPTILGGQSLQVARL